METMILLNGADQDEGFFVFTTTNRNDRNRFVARVGQENILEEKIWNDKGVPAHWSLRVNSQAFSRQVFGVRSQAQLDAAASGRGKPVPDHVRARLSKFYFPKGRKQAA